MAYGLAKRCGGVTCDIDRLALQRVYGLSGWGLGFVRYKQNACKDEYIDYVRGHFVASSTDNSVS